MISNLVQGLHSRLKFWDWKCEAHFARAIKSSFVRFYSKMEVKCGPLFFFSTFDSGNLAKVEKVCKDEMQVSKANEKSKASKPKEDIMIPTWDYEYNVWTSPDCAGTVYENGNRSWFYFGVKGGQPGKTIKLNVMNMNRQGKLYGQGMTPVVKTVPSRISKWERIRDKVTNEVIYFESNILFSKVKLILSVSS